MGQTLADAIALWENGWTAGETKTQLVSFDGFAPPTYDVRYDFSVGTGRFGAACTDTGTGYRLTLSTALTESAEPGQYVYVASAIDAAGNSTVVDRGVVALLPNPTRITYAQRCLAAIRARIEGRATADQLTMQMGDVILAYMTPPQLLEWQNVFEQRCASEHNAAKAATGKAGASYRVFTEFQR